MGLRITVDGFPKNIIYGAPKLLMGLRSNIIYLCMGLPKMFPGL